MMNNSLLEVANGLEPLTQKLDSEVTKIHAIILFFLKE